MLWEMVDEVRTLYCCPYDFLASHYTSCLGRSPSRILLSRSKRQDLIGTRFITSPWYDLLFISPATSSVATYSPHHCSPSAGYDFTAAMKHQHSHARVVLRLFSPGRPSLILQVYKALSRLHATLLPSCQTGDPCHKYDPFSTGQGYRRARPCSFKRNLNKHTITPRVLPPNYNRWVYFLHTTVYISTLDKMTSTVVLNVP
jgi:hypothetical protein